VGKLIERLIQECGGQVLLLCYGASPCDYGLYRQIVEAGHECEVVDSSLIPKKAGERVKTDRADALKLVRYLRSGDPAAV
jgi:transposase